MHGGNIQKVQQQKSKREQDEAQTNEKGTTRNKTKKEGIGQSKKTRQQ